MLVSEILRKKSGPAITMTPHDGVPSVAARPAILEGPRNTSLAARNAVGHTANVADPLCGEDHDGLRQRYAPSSQKALAEVEPLRVCRGWK